MFDAVEQWQHRGLTVSIVPEEYPDNPRDSWDSLGTILGQTRSFFAAGDNYSDRDAPKPAYGDMPELIAETITKPGTVYVPLQYQDYGSNGAQLLADQGCEYDPDIHNGVIYVDRAKWQRKYRRTRLTNALRARILECLIGEIETQDAYYQGDVYGFMVSDSHNEHLDSCWGFYGADRESMAYLRSEATAAADAIADDRQAARDRRAAELDRVASFWNLAA